MNSPKCPALLKASISPCTPAFSLILQSKLQTLQKIQDLLKLHTAGPGETGETLGYFCKDDSFEVKLVYTLSSLPPCYGLHLLGNVNLILNGISLVSLVLTHHSSIRHLLAPSTTKPQAAHTFLPPGAHRPRDKAEKCEEPHIR